MPVELFRLSQRLRREAVRLKNTATRTCRRVCCQVQTTGPEAVRCVQLVIAGALWVTFETFRRIWSWLGPVLENTFGIRPAGPYRLPFCILLAELSGHLLVFTFTPWSLSLRSLVFAAVGGMVIHASWDRGWRWCRVQLGLRPLRYDPARPFDGLDLGN